MSYRPRLPLLTRTQSKELYRNNAGIWFDKSCEIERLTPKYIQIKVNGNILIF
jgi:hypothetical protein